jgi:anhydro-N-acetylmuramic acid kinase
VKGKRYAFDICFCNMGLNHLASENGKPFDKNGEMAASGTIHHGLLRKLNKIYAKLRVKRPSLGREIFETQIVELLGDKSISLNDRLCTFSEAAAIEICDAISSRKAKAKVLCTGGGAFNSFLIARMLHHGGDDLTFIIPEEEVIKFKEAMVFAFLGVLRIRDEINCLKTVTNASRDSSSGTLIGFSQLE